MCLPARPEPAAETPCGEGVGFAPGRQIPRRRAAPAHARVHEEAAAEGLRAFALAHRSFAAVVLRPRRLVRPLRLTFQTLQFAPIRAEGTETHRVHVGLATEELPNGAIDAAQVGDGEATSVGKQQRAGKLAGLGQELLGHRAVSSRRTRSIQTTAPTDFDVAEPQSAELEIL